MGRRAAAFVWACLWACDVSPLERVPPPDPPPAPADLRIVAATSSSLELAWGPVEGADGYRLTRSDTRDGDFARVVYEGPDMMAADRGLEASQTWYYRVRARGVGGLGAVSAVVEGTTTATRVEDRVPPGPIRDLSVVTGDLEGELRARWTNPRDDDLVGVAFRYRTDGAFPGALDDGSPLTSATGTTGIVWSDLDPAQAYAVSGFAFDAVPNYAPAVEAAALGRPRGGASAQQWRETTAANFRQGEPIDTRIVEHIDGIMLMSHPASPSGRVELDVGEDVGGGPMMPHVLRTQDGGYRMYYAFDAGGHRRLAAKTSQDGLTEWSAAIDLGLGTAQAEATEPFAYPASGRAVELYYTEGGDSLTTGRLMMARSSDGIANWSTPTPVDVGFSPTGSAFLLDWVDGSTRLYFSTFTDPSWDLAVAISTDGRATWTQARLLGTENDARNLVWPWVVPLRDGAYRLYWGSRRVDAPDGDMGVIHRRTPDGLSRFENGVGAGAMLDARGYSILPLDDGRFRFYFGERRDNGDLLLVARDTDARFASFGSYEGPVRGGQNDGLDFQDISWVATTPPGTRVSLQLRSGQSRTALGLWTGPSEGVSSYESSPAVPNPVHDGDRWLQYRVILETEDETVSPVLHEISIGYTPL